MLADSIVRHNIIRVDKQPTKDETRVVCNCGWMSDYRMTEEDGREFHKKHVMEVARQLQLDEEDRNEITKPK